jgi:hypothetical protein
LARRKLLLIPRQLGRQLLPQHIDQSQELALAARVGERAS